MMALDFEHNGACSNKAWAHNIHMGIHSEIVHNFYSKAVHEIHFWDY